MASLEHMYYLSGSERQFLHCPGGQGVDVNKRRLRGPTVPTLDVYSLVVMEGKCEECNDSSSLYAPQEGNYGIEKQ